MPIPQVPIPDGYGFRDIQLELSLKPFFDNTPETRELVIREVFTQWQALWRHADSVSLMLWIAEGSEILEYDGRLETAFEWARYHGAPNRHRWEMPEQSRKGKPDHAGIGINTGPYDPEGKGIHARAYSYRPEQAVFTYGWLRDLVADIKRIGAEMTGKPVFVGETFDIGPEFAVSRFKYDWHREILSDGPIFKEQFISCEAVLHGDDRCYAGYSNGIPEGTRIGAFLGRQLNCLFRDCGFDFLWLSNGFGFSLEPWALVGEVFDGTRYHRERSADIQKRVLQFWQDLRDELPTEYHIRSRGTNMATGIDLGSDASPLKAIYEGGFAVDAAVNSPWAAIDGDFGLELSGWMSHIARHPGDTFRYRFYTHDPWWLNSPWLDRYARQPHDIYLPLAVSRLQANGQVEIPRDIAFLTIDDSHGQMPLAVPNEVTAHILKARETAPDASGPLLWVYPFDDFHALATEGKLPEVPLHADSLIGAAINEGLPLNTVVDAGELATSLGKMPAGLAGTILVSPVPVPGSETERVLLDATEQGRNLLLYGPVPEDSAFKDLLGVSLGETVEGDFTLEPSELDNLTDVGRTLRHTSILSGGGWKECLTDPGNAAALTAQARQGGQTRVALLTKSHLAGGRITWTRGSLSTAEYDPEDPKPIRGPILQALDRRTFYPAGRLLVAALNTFDWALSFVASDTSPRAPYLTVHRHRNAYMLSGHSRDEHTVQRIRMPLGAPLLSGRNNKVAGGCTAISGRSAWQNEVRVFLAESEDGCYACEEPPPLMHAVNRRLLVHGCRNSTLRFLIDPEHRDSIRILRDPHFPYFAGDFVEPVIQQTEHGSLITVEGVNGSILFEW